MSLDKYQELEENIKLRNKLLCAGIGYQIVGPTGPQGPTGMTGIKECKGQLLYLQTRVYFLQVFKIRLYLVQ